VSLSSSALKGHRGVATIMGAQESQLKFPLSPLQSQIWLINLKFQVQPFTHLSRNVLREICDYLRIPQFLPVLCGCDISLHCFETGAVTTAKLPVAFSDGAVCCVYGEKAVLCLGGDPPSAEVYRVNLPSLVLDTLTPMRRARAWPGILPLGSLVYVFGGSLRSCEKLQTGVWTSLPDMLSAKCAFTPVSCNALILLCAFASDVESFHTKKEVFVRLPLQLPGDSSPSLAFLAGDWLHVLGRERAVRWKMGTEKVETWSLQRAFEGCTGVPVRVGERIYWADLAGEVVWYDIDRREVMQ